MNTLMTKNGKNRCPNCFYPDYNHIRCPRCAYLEGQGKSSAKALSPGTILENKYYIGILLGEGGFGLIYKVLNLENNCIYAIKEFAPKNQSYRTENLAIQCTAQGAVIFREAFGNFVQEAKRLEQLKPIPAIVDFIGFFHANNTAYIVMEYLTGRNLAEIAETGQLPASGAAHYLEKAAFALERIHLEFGFIHGDVSPGNIHITSDGQVKLIDLGNARSIGYCQPKDLPVVVNQKFSPPEQYSGRFTQGPYTDVYALAATLYFVLTKLNLPTAKERSQGKAYVPLKQINPQLPAAVSEALDTALCYYPQRRMQTAGQLIHAVLRPLMIKAPPVNVVPYIKILSGGQKHQIWKFPSNVAVRVGRSKNRSDIVIFWEALLSRLHFEIYFDAGTSKFRIIDKSSLGTSRLETGLKNTEVRLKKETPYYFAAPGIFNLAQTLYVEIGVMNEQTK